MAGALALAAGFLVVSYGYLALLGGAAAIGAGATLNSDLWRRSFAAASSRGGVLALLLLAYLVPLVMFGRAYALVGHSPVFLADALLVLAVALMLPKARFHAIGPAPLVATLVAMLAARSVYVGVEHDFPAAVKGLVLVVYPMLAVVVAGWVAGHDNPNRLLAWLARYVLPLSALGLGIGIAADTSIIPAAYGLYLGVAAAFAVTRGVPRQKLLAFSVLVGLALLIVLTAKRGPAFTVVLAGLAAWIAGAHSRSQVRTAGLTAAVLAGVVAAALAFSSGLASPTDLPGAGRFVERTVSSRSGLDSSAANNVTLRQALLSYALSTAYEENPLLGVGAFHPVEVDLFGTNIAEDPGSGIHNSFAGYAFYAGFPAGALVVALFAMGLWRTWRIRHANMYAPALFGALVAAVATALTNVALETTYIGGPSWLVLAAALGVAGWQREHPAASRPVPADQGRGRPTDGAATLRQ